jgi:hypothetical protein
MRQLYGLRRSPEAGPATPSGSSGAPEQASWRHYDGGDDDDDDDDDDDFGSSGGGGGNGYSLDDDDDDDDDDGNEEDEAERLFRWSQELPADDLTATVALAVMLADL